VDGAAVAIRNHASGIEEGAVEVKGEHAVAGLPGGVGAWRLGRGHRVHAGSVSGRRGAARGGRA
jgi:hypothetical protein